MNKIKKEPAIVFVGFKHKADSPKAARDFGFKTILIALQELEKGKELFDEIYITDIKDSEKVDKVIKDIKSKYRAKGVLTNYEHYVVIRSYIAEHLGVPSTSVYASSCTRNKALQRHALEFLPGNLASRRVQTEKEALAAWEDLGKDVFIKNISGVKSKLVFHCKTEKDVKDAMKANLEGSKIPDADLFDAYEYMNFYFKYPNPNNTFLVEKTAKGVLISIDSIVGSRKIWHTPSAVDNVTARELGINDSFLAYSTLPSKLSEDQIQKAKKIVTGAIRILGLRNCCVHTELMVDGDEINLIEIASRMGGYRHQMYKYAYNLNLSEFLVKAVVGKDKSSQKKKATRIARVEIFPREEGQFVEITGLDEFKEQYGKFIIDSSVKQNLGVIGPSKLGYGPAAKLFLTAKKYETLEEVCKEAICMIQAVVK